MNRHGFGRFAGSVLCLGSLAACERVSSVPAPPAASIASARAVPTVDSGNCVAQQTLERLDQRALVPLLPHMANHQKQNMRDHLLAVQEVVQALASDDFPAAVGAAARLGYSPQMGQMCSHMGAAAPGFSERALAFHHTADGLVSAARTGDRGAVLDALATTLRGCTGCHEAFQQRVVDEPTFQAQSPSH